MIKIYSKLHYLIDVCLCSQTRHTRKHVGGDRRRARRCRGHRHSTALHGWRPSSSRRGLSAATRSKGPSQPQNWRENELWLQCPHTLPVMHYGHRGMNSYNYYQFYYKKRLQYHLDDLQMFKLKLKS